MIIKTNNVSNRGGDQGETNLAGGKRVKKSHIIIELIGTIDELNAFLGAAKANIDAKTVILKSEIELLQQQLLDLGAEIAFCYQTDREGISKLKEESVSHLEKLCEFYNEDLSELSSFIIPGGSNLSASLHIARTVARRAERLAVIASESIEINLDLKIISYLNRLSNLLFIFARWAQKHQGIPEILRAKECDRI